MSHRPPSWKRRAPGPPPGSALVAGQDALPHLPVPDLTSTIARLRLSLQPLAHTPEELAATNRKIAEFENGIAKELQARLVQRAKETDNWLEEWWDAYAHLADREPVVRSVSYFYGFAPHPAHYPQTSVHRAAALARSALLFRRQYRTGKLRPEVTKEGPLCMDSYRWMFDCCRIPGPGEDWAESHARPDEEDLGHIIVMRKNRFWKIDVAPEGKALSTADLERQFKYIYEQTFERYPAIGVLSASTRDVWVKDYEALVRDPLNASIVRDIHASAFLICLDDTHPNDQEDFSRQLWHGGSNGKWLANRWVDKPLQFIICDGPGAPAGIMCEHSIMDGMATARMCNDVVGALHNPKFDHGSPSTTVLAPPVPLDFNVTPALFSFIRIATSSARELTESQVLRIVTTSYGKKAVKHFGFLPDSWAQMMIQLAYARLLKRVGWQRKGGTYEAAMTRKFSKGRTETVRIVSSEGDEWTKAMDEKRRSDTEKKGLFRKAVALHLRRSKEATNAQGVDRHLLGINPFVTKSVFRILTFTPELGLERALQPSDTVPELFTDPLFLRSSRWVLFSSQLFSPYFIAYGWGAVVPDGFSIAYMCAFDNNMFFNLTCRKGMPMKELSEEMEKAANDMYGLFAAEEKVQARL
jgi:carnitine O-acetyltransferase